MESPRSKGGLDGNTRVAKNNSPPEDKKGTNKAQRNAQLMFRVKVKYLFVTGGSRLLSCGGIIAKREVG